MGALGAALPEATAESMGAELKPPQAQPRYAALGLLALLLYRRLPRAVETADPVPAPAKPLGRSRRIVFTLAGRWSAMGSRRSTTCFS